MSTIRALFIFEVMGKPAEHIVASLEQMVDKLKGQKTVTITSTVIHPAKEIEKEGVSELFTTFAEVEVVCDDLMTVFQITLNMLPSHVEILQPEVVGVKNFDLSSVLTELAMKLHKYDEVAKVMAFERNHAVTELEELRKEKGVEKDGETYNKQERDTT